MRHARIQTTILLFFLILPRLGMTAVTFDIKAGEPNEVVFVSHAPGETFEGKTSAISGTITFDPTDLTAPLEGQIVVDAKTLDTGIALRNNHMYENHLEVEKYPTIEFTPLKLVDPSMPALRHDGTVEAQIQGEFTLHGVTQTLTAPVSFSYAPQAGKLDVVATFKVALENFQIARPQFLFLKLAEEQEIEVKFTATTK